METLSPVLQILLAVLALASLVVAGVLIAVGLIIRRILLRIHRMLMDIESTEQHLLGEAEELLGRVRNEGSLLMRLALAFAGSFILKQVHYSLKRKRHVTRANRV